MRRLLFLVLLWPTVASADFYMKTGTFLKPEGAAPAMAVITGLGFTPKLIILGGTPDLGVGAQWGGFNNTIGWSDGTNDYCISASVEDAASIHNPNSALLARTYAITTSGSSSVQAACTTYAFGNGVCSLNFVTNNAMAYYIHYMAIGGSDITSVKVGVDSTGSSTGNQATTTVGFQPELVMFAMPYIMQAAGNSDNGGSCFGAASGASNEGTMVWYGRSGSDPGNVKQALRSGYCIGAIDTVGGTAGDTLSILGDINSFDANGYTINYTKTLGTRYAFTYLAIKGGNWYVGSETAKSSSGTKATTGVGFTPVGLMGFSMNDTVKSDWTLDNFIRVCFGFAGPTAGTDENCYGGYAEGGRLADSAARFNVTAYFLNLYEEQCPATTGSNCDVSSFDASGFTLNWATSDTARQFIYIAGGAETGGGSVTSTKIGAVELGTVKVGP